MKVVKLTDALENRAVREEIVRRVRHGAVIVYPTDTVYGIGCNATDSGAVSLVRKLKGTKHPFSVIAPSMEWIRENFDVRFPEYLDMLPGPLTLILRKRRECVSENVSFSGSVGVRIPSHPFTAVLQETGVPVVSTSANISGQKTIERIGGLPEGFRKEVSIAVDGGTLGTRASRIIDLTGERPRVVRE